MKKILIVPARYCGGHKSAYSGIDRNGGYYLAGTLDSVTDPMGQPGAFFNYPSYFMKLDTNLNTVWTWSAGDSNHIFRIFTVKQLRNRNYLLVGLTNVPDTPGFAGWLAVVDTGGHLQWSRRYYRSAIWNHQLFDALENADGSITAVGYGKDDAGPWETQSEMWVLQVDSNGCEGPGLCSPSLSVPTGPGTMAVGVFRVYPNPVARQFVAETPEAGTLTLVGLQGQVVGQWALPKGTSTWDFPVHAASGLYLGQFRSRSGQLQTVRITYQP